MNTPIENLQDAFSPGYSSCRGQCDCGQKYFDAVNQVDWEEGELDKLKQEGATPLGGAVGWVVIEGKELVVGCSCWEPFGRRVVSFLSEHSNAIARFLTLEKRRREAEAKNSPTVEG